MVRTLAALLLAACGPAPAGDLDAAAVPDARPVDARPLDAPPPDADLRPDAAPANVTVVITADNAYGFGYGTATAMVNYFGGIENTLAGDIFNGAETYTVPESDSLAGDYLYIVAWDDSSTTQGVIGQFARAGGATVYTGDGAWEVCATGVRHESGSGDMPTLTDINDQLVLCNAGTTSPVTTSAGWVNATGTTAGALQVGEDNTTTRVSVTPGNEFPIVTGIDGAARWMWFNWSPSTIVWPTTSPFIWSGSGNVDKQFLIFRLRAEVVE
jgi:hypothetical protein